MTALRTIAVALLAATAAAQHCNQYCTSNADCVESTCGMHVCLTGDAGNFCNRGSIGPLNVSTCSSARCDQCKTTTVEQTMCLGKKYGAFPQRYFRCLGNHTVELRVFPSSYSCPDGTPTNVTRFPANKCIADDEGGYVSFACGNQ